MVSHNNTKGNAGRRYYSCGACDFFHWLDAPSTVAGATAAGSSQDDGRRISFYAIDDPDTHERLQQLFCVPANVRLGVGRDYLASGHAGGGYDYLRVVNAWRVINPDKLARYERFRSSLASHAQLRALPVASLRERCIGAGIDTASFVEKDDFVRAIEAAPPPSVPLRSAHDAASAAVMGAASMAALPPLASRDGELNEALLLHGTKPQHLHSLLFDGLDPQVSSDGLFGRGVYFAEDAAKIDQYVGVDTRDRRAEPTRAPPAPPQALCRRRRSTLGTPTMRSRARGCLADRHARATVGRSCARPRKAALRTSSMSTTMRRARHPPSLPTLSGVSFARAGMRSWRSSAARSRAFESLCSFGRRRSRWRRSWPSSAAGATVTARMPDPSRV